MNEDLARIIDLNENVKVISLGALRIERLAINATLLAKRVGQQAAGFSIITDELREFSLGMAQCMGHLRQTTFAHILLTSRALRQQRQAILLADALRAGLALNMRHGMQTMRSELYALEGRLREVVEQAEELLRFADVICRGAKIEAAYGGDWRGQLTEVANQFAQLIGDITPMLDKTMRIVQTGHQMMRNNIEEIDAAPGAPI